MKTITTAFAATVAARPDVVALRAGAGADAPTLTWRDYADGAGRIAGGLAGLGLRPGERVALMLRNRPEFHVADLGVLLAGGTPVSIYNSSPPDRIAYVVDHAGARLAIVEEGGHYSYRRHWQPWNKMVEAFLTETEGNV